MAQMAKATSRKASLWRTTAVRLALLYSLIFSVLAIGVVIYISTSSASLLLQQTRVAIDAEVIQLSRHYRRYGTSRLIGLIERRSRRPGANLYHVVAPNGRVLAGNISTLEAKVLARPGWRLRPFKYTHEAMQGRRNAEAIGRVFNLSGGGRLLVGQDVTGLRQVRRNVRRAASIALGAMALTALLLTLFLGRRAVRRLDRVTATTSKVVAGDLSQRLPETGGGDEFDRLAHALNGVLERVDMLNSGVRAVSDNIAHDLRTPLTRLRNRADALTRSKDADEQQEVAADIVAEADGLIATFDALLLISQTQSGARSVPMDNVELRPLMEDLHELFEPSADEANGSLALDLNCSPTLKGNRELLAQAITNLLDNALKYGGTNGRGSEVNLALTCDDAFARIIVSDCGRGIDAEDRSKAVTRFGRLDASRNMPGSGLGLSLVDATAELHGGTLYLQDNEPGLKAVLELPLER